MSRIPQSFIDDLLTRVDIVSVVDSRVKLKRAGKNYTACCPFHQEKTPSFTVSPDKQFYYCFGCGASGNAIGFVMEYDREGFVDAVESLAKDVGVEIPREERPKEFRQQDFKRKKLYQILEKASGFYQEQLKQHPQKHRPVQYLKNRGLTGIIARDFGLGFAPPGFDHLLNRLGSNEENVSLLIDAGLVIHKEEEKKKYDRFRNRITFPIRDERGRVIGFGGRVLGDEKPKYLNSPETQVFHKGRELYGLYEAKQANRKLESLLVVEGYMDVIALAQYGVTHAVATLGTACGEEHLKLAFRYVSDIVFCFDGDNAGRMAAKRGLLNSLSSMEDGRQIKFLFLPEGQDPDSLIRQIGKERFIAQTQQAIPLEEFLFEVAAEGIDLSSMDGRARFSKTAAPLIGELPEGIFRELMQDNLAKRTGLSREVLNELKSEKIEIATEPTQPSPPVQKRSNQAESVETYPNVPELPVEAYETEAVPNFIEAETTLNADAPTPKLKRSNINISPAKTATIILLEHPQLLQSLQEFPAFEESSDEEKQRLAEIISYLKRRPNSNFSNILGFWGGSKGVDEQQKLASLMMNQLRSSIKSVKIYDPLKELHEALISIQKKQDRQQILREIHELKSRGLSNLSTEEKQKLIELTRSQTQISKQEEQNS